MNFSSGVHGKLTIKVRTKSKSLKTVLSILLVVFVSICVLKVVKLTLLLGLLVSFLLPCLGIFRIAKFGELFIENLDKSLITAKGFHF